MLPTRLFLMHRVELKEFYCDWDGVLYSSVPNAPCGVERWPSGHHEQAFMGVPNAPCGVERTLTFRSLSM